MNRAWLALAAAAATAAVVFDVPVLRVVAGCALAFVLPGYALVGAGFARAWLSSVERAVLTPAASLAVVVLGGLGLFVAHARLTTPAWALLAGGVTIVAALWWKRPPVGLGRSTGSGTRRWIAPATIALVLLGTSAWVSVHSAVAARDTVAVTQLSILPTHTVRDQRATTAVTIDVTTTRTTPTAYRVVVTGPRDYRTEIRPTIDRDGAWSDDIAVPTGGRVTADLFRGADPQPYRSVFLDLSP